MTGAGAAVRAVGVALCDVTGEQPGLPKRARMAGAGQAAFARALEPWVDRKRAKLLADDVGLAHLAVAGAFREIGSDPPRASGPRTGVFVGTRLTSRMDPRLSDAIARAGRGPRPDCADYFRGLASGVNPVRLLSYVSHRTALHLAISLGAKGAVRTYGGSALASARALHEALGALRRGEVDCAIVGGVDAGRDPVGHALEAVSGASEPGAGVAAFAVLERETDGSARPRTGRLLAVEVAHGAADERSLAEAADRARAAAGAPDAPALALELPSCARGTNGAAPLLLAAALERLASRAQGAPSRAVCAFGDARARASAAFVLEAT